MVIWLDSIHRTFKNKQISEIIWIFIFTINKTAVDFQGVKFQTNNTTTKTQQQQATTTTTPETTTTTTTPENNRRYS